MKRNTESDTRRNGKQNGWKCAYGERLGFPSYVAWYLTNGCDHGLKEALDAPRRGPAGARLRAMMAASYALLSGGDADVWERLVIMIDYWGEPTDERVTNTIEQLGVALVACSDDLQRCRPSSRYELAGHEFEISIEQAGKLLAGIWDAWEHRGMIDRASVPRRSSTTGNGSK